MNYWLVKSEPETWSWLQQKKVKVEKWNGVRNYQAAKNLQGMRLDDLAFFYHSGKEKQIVGIVRVVKEYYPDPTDQTGRFGMVDLETVEDLPTPVTLQKIKAQPGLTHLALVRQSRLSVMSIDEKSWQLIYKLAQSP
jgi:predicted RNA-binding protein with PUA-like domain